MPKFMEPLCAARVGVGCPGASSKAGGWRPAAHPPLHLHSKALCLLKVNVTH